MYFKFICIKHVSRHSKQAHDSLKQLFETKLSRLFETHRPMLKGNDKINYKCTEVIHRAKNIYEKYSSYKIDAV